MPREVIVTAGAQATRWSRQFCRQLPWTVTAGGRTAGRDLVLLRAQTRPGIVAAISSAAARARRGGTVIYNIGHGYGGAAGANVLMSTGPEFTVNARILNGGERVVTPRAVITSPLTADEADVRAHFLRIGDVIRAQGVARFVFLVCGVGANPTFLRLIRTVWGDGVAVSGYADGVVLEDDVAPRDPTYPRTRLYLWSDGGNINDPRNRARLGTGSSATPASWLELPPGAVEV
jgi:hypothetical protein